MVVLEFECKLCGAATSITLNAKLPRDFGDWCMSCWLMKTEPPRNKLALLGSMIHELRSGYDEHLHRRALYLRRLIRIKGGK